MNPYSLKHLADPVLRKDLLSASRRRSGADALEIAHIAEFDDRRLYLPEGYPSMHQFCIQVLEYSEDEADTRICVARAAHEFPAIYAMLEDRRLNQTAVLRLAGRLNKDNAEDLLAAAAHRTKAQLALLFAERFPQPDMPTLVMEIGPVAEPSAASNPGQGCIQPVPERVDRRFPRAKVTPLSPHHFGYQFTGCQEAHDLYGAARRRATSASGVSHPVGRGASCAVGLSQGGRSPRTSCPRLTSVRSTPPVPGSRGPLDSPLGKPDRSGRHYGVTRDHRGQFLASAPLAGRRSAWGAKRRSRAGSEARDGGATGAPREPEAGCRRRTSAFSRPTRGGGPATSRVQRHAGAGRRARAAAAQAKSERDELLAAAADVTPALKALGARGEDLYTAAKLCAEIPNASQKERILHAIRGIGRANMHRMTPGVGCPA